MCMKKKKKKKLRKITFTKSSLNTNAINVDYLLTHKLDVQVYT